MKQEDKFCDISNVVYMNMMSKYCNNPMKQDVIIIRSHTWDWGLIIWCVGKWLCRHATLIVPYLIRTGPRRNWLSSSLINEIPVDQDRSNAEWMIVELIILRKESQRMALAQHMRVTRWVVTHSKVNTEMMSVLTWFAALSFVVGFCLLACLPACLLCFALL